MANLGSNLPVVRTPFLDGNGQITQPWLMFLIQLYQRTGGNQTPALDLTQVQQSSLLNPTIVDANGFNGTIVSGTNSTITLETTVTGMVKGNGTALSAAVSGTDYAPPTSGTSILYGNGAGGFSNVTIGANLNFTGGTLSAVGGGISPASYAFAAAHG